jgi:ankyrin repeat protein
MYFAYRTSPHIFRDFIVYFEGKINEVDNEGKSALMYAAIHGKTVNLELLLDHGASISQLDFLGRSAISHAVIHMRPEIVQILIARNAELQLLDTNGNTLLMLAAASSSVTNIKLLMNKVQHSLNRVNLEGQTALIIAAMRKNNDDVAASLINFAPRGAIDLNKQDTLYQRTALMHAVE